MRIADKMAFDQVQTNVSKNRKQMSDLQNQAATQKRVTRPSDDPLAAARVLGSRVDLTGNKQFTKNLNYAKSYLEMTDQALNDMSEALVRAKDLALSQSNDASANEETRKVVATEIRQLFDQLVQVGNRKLGERFIFGGFNTTGSPFSREGNYQGDEGEILIHVDKDSFVSMNLPGNRVFHGVGLGADGVSSATKEQPRTIEEWLASNESPKKPGASVAEPGGPEVPTGPSPRYPWTEQPKEAEVRGPAATPASPRFPWSEQGELPEKYGSPSSNGVNVFDVLQNLEVALMSNDKMGVQDSLDTLDSALSQVVLSRSLVGSRSMTLDNFFQTMEKAKVDNQITISQLEDADIFSTVSDINKTESTLQATLQTSGKLIQKSLLDFLG